MSHSPQELAEAMAAATPVYLPLYRPFPTSLVPPRAPALPPQVPVSRDIVADPIPKYAPAISKPPTAAEKLGGVTMQLDIAVERRRSFW
jgi:hypothetical protein